MPSLVLWAPLHRRERIPAQLPSAKTLPILKHKGSLRRMS
ncbi:hypothetical protein ACVWWY_002548 [Thermostichus sp. OS-CIW-38]